MISFIFLTYRQGSQRGIQIQVEHLRQSFFKKIVNRFLAILVKKPHRRFTLFPFREVLQKTIFSLFLIYFLLTYQQCLGLTLCCISDQSVVSKPERSSSTSQFPLQQSDCTKYQHQLIGLIALRIVPISNSIIAK